jgi:sodium pump decarboxylase gamma subunit
MFGIQMIAEVNAGLELMAVGMSIVFLFLLTLILMANAMSKLIQKLYPDTVVDAGTSAATATIGAADAQVVAAISAAVQHYRAEK